jgi:hypothetical protein
LLDASDLDLNKVRFLQRAAAAELGWIARQAQPWRPAASRGDSCPLFLGKAKVQWWSDLGGCGVAASRALSSSPSSFGVRVQRVCMHTWLLVSPPPLLLKEAITDARTAAWPDWNILSTPPPKGLPSQTSKLRRLIWFSAAGTYLRAYKIPLYRMQISAPWLLWSRRYGTF